MRKRRLWLAIPVGLACVLVPACSSRNSGETAPKAAATPPAAGAAPALGAAPAREPVAGNGRPGRAASPAPQKAAASGPGRRHPFAPVIDEAARRAQVSSKAGPLELKGIVTGPHPVAIIEEGGVTQYVHKGEQVGGLVLLEIGEGEVVLGSGRQKRVLPLYPR
jgi:hypothetical protein